MGYIGELRDDKEILESDRRILIYGTGGYGEKIYRSLKFYNKVKNIVAFIDRNQAKHGQTLHGIPIISIEEAISKYSDTIVCIGGETKGNIKHVELLHGLNDIHQITFNINCNLCGTEYGGFYLPKDLSIQNFIIYSFGIGEDLSFSEAMIDRGGTVYAFDPTPKSIKYVKEHKLFENTNFHFLPYGLSDKNGKEKFNLPIRSEWVSGSVISHQYVNDKNVIEVEMRTIRTIMKELNHSHIDILKLDIEGSEFKVMNNIWDPSLDTINLDYICLETHERFFVSHEKEYIEKFYSNMNNSGFFDFYGMDNEPTFVKCKN